MAFGAETTTDEVLEGIDLNGKHAIVTGASGGLGEETARALASKGATITIAARNVARSETAAAKIREATGNPNVSVGELELDDLDSIRRFVDKWTGENDQLHLLVNNAGVMACPLTRTTKGWELQFATNHVGHFLLTGLLLPTLKNSAPARIVNLSSAGHKLGDVDLNDPYFENRNYDKWTAYGQSKTANILFSVALNSRLSNLGITANAVHPGGIQTDLGRHLQESDMAALIERITGEPMTEASANAIQFKSVAAGSATSVWAATSPDLEGKGGLYLEDCSIGELVEPTGGLGAGYLAYAMDAEAADRLWAFSESLVGQSFD